jgi:hypothetical protein
MIHYSYNRQIQPPAPFVHVTVRCAETQKQITDLPAQLDTAADRSAIPGSVAGELALVPLDELPVSGFGGQVLRVPTFLVEMSIRRLPAVTLEVLAHPEEPYILLGRDILNHFRILLDGPRLTLEIG